MRKTCAFFIAIAMAAFGAWADTWTDPATGITWTYTVSGGKASVGGRNDVGYRAELAGLVEAQRNATGEADRLRRELAGVDFETLAARREKADDEEKKAIDGLFAKRTRAEQMEKEVVRLQNEARQRVAARRQKEAAERGNF